MVKLINLSETGGPGPSWRARFETAGFDGRGFGVGAHDVIHNDLQRRVTLRHVLADDVSPSHPLTARPRAF